MTLFSLQNELYAHLPCQCQQLYACRQMRVICQKPSDGLQLMKLAHLYHAEGYSL